MTVREGHPGLRVQDGVAAVVMLPAAPVLVHLLFFLLLTLLGKSPDFSNEALYLAAAIIGYPLAMIGMVLLAQSRGNLAEIGLVKPPSAWRWATTWCIALAVLGAVALNLLGGVNQDASHWDFASMTMLVLILFVFQVVILAPFAEELAYRGVLMAAVGQRFGTTAACIISIMLFTAMHILAVGDVPGLAQIALLATLTTFLRVHCSSLLPPILLHVIYNLFAIAGPLMTMD